MLTEVTRRAREVLVKLDYALSTIAAYSSFTTTSGRFDSLAKAMTTHRMGGDDTGFRAYMRVYNPAAGATYSVFKTNFYHPGGGTIIAWGARLRMTNNINATSTLTPKFRIDGGAWQTFTGGATSLAAFATVRGSATVAHVGALTAGFHTFELGISSSAAGGTTEWVGYGDMEGSFFESPGNGAAVLQARWGQ